ncbi:hypothetical protein M9H77_05053 [Catharanthus roseus]|uniref:Uncharacterized protein n=1 Tax=Catharanthus roseus TaxID=4058 RepID=A0ACC0CFW7_CATRO|nr:hypothetical protein M9H77_05053 [Catharanthus roseus]
MVSDEPSMLYNTVNNDDDEVDGSDGDDAVSSQSESNDDNDPEEGEFQTPQNPVNPINPLGCEYRVLKSRIDTWTARYYNHSDDNYCSWYICIKKKAMHGRWEITRFVKEHTCLVQIEQNKHKNLSSKFISMFISHLVANDPEIPVSNIIQEMQLRKMANITLPCSHVLAVCKENGSKTYTYVPEIYSRQTYRRTYQANFHLVLSENFWRDVPFSLTFYPPNMKKERDWKQDKPFQGEMDYRNPDSPPRCSRCRMSRHNRKNCNNPRPSNV